MYNNYFNPMMPMQQRLQQYDQQQQQQQMYQQPVYGQQAPANSNNMVKCRAVTSIDEAKAAMIDLDGSITIFTDFGHKRIYTKQINLDGTASLDSYLLESPGALPEPVSEDRVKVLEETVLLLKGEIDELKSNATNANGKSTKKQSKSTTANATNV